MVNIYDELKDSDGNVLPGRTKFFIVETDENNNITRSYDGTSIIPESNGTLFIVDNWLIDQIDKVVFVDGTLQVKEGEQLDEPVKTDKELQREELLRQLALLDADTEETTDEP